MDDQLKFSIITVCFNAQSSIEKTITSFLSQNYPDKELIIVDGASTDGTLGIVHHYADRIAKIISEKDSGIYDAMNKGIQAATGDAICFLNADDSFYDANVLSSIALAFKQNPHADLIYGKLSFSDLPQNLKFDPNQYNKERKTKLAMIVHSMPHQATFAKKEVFTRVGGFDLKFKIGADYDWFLRCATAKVPMLFVDRYISTFSYQGVSYQKRYIHIPERIELVWKNATFIEFCMYAVIASARFAQGVVWEYIISPLRKRSNTGKDLT